LIVGMFVSVIVSVSVCACA